MPAPSFPNEPRLRGCPDDTGRYSDCRALRRDIPDHNSPGPDNRVGADLDSVDDRRASMDMTAFSQCHISRRYHTGIDLAALLQDIMVIYLSAVLTITPVRIAAL